MPPKGWPTIKDRRYVIDGKHRIVARVVYPPPANTNKMSPAGGGKGGGIISLNWLVLGFVPQPNLRNNSILEQNIECRTRNIEFRRIRKLHNSKFLVLRFGVLFKVELSRWIDSVPGEKYG
ncbi:MAG: hypothetical protein E3K40_01455 [Candidatus Brocadia sp.]|nr:hypothetical protein [Candidatus Brocadia sp.]